MFTLIPFNPTTRAATLALILSLALTPLTHAEILATGEINIPHDGSDPWQIVPDLRISEYNPASLMITNGSSFTTLNDIMVANRSLGSGSITVQGEDSTITANAISLGVYGVGLLTITDSAKVESGPTSIATTSDSVGIAHIADPDSNWNIDGALRIGQNGHATLSIHNQAQVNVSRDTTISMFYNAKGTLQLNDGTLNTQGLIASTHDITGQGTINANTIYSDFDLTFDATHPTNQSIHLNNPNQDITINLNASNPDNSGTLGVGLRQAAHLTIADGVTVHSWDGYVGSYGTNEPSSATITGQDSTWNLGRTLNIQYGQLNHLDQAAINTRNVHIYANSTYHLDGGTLSFSGTTGSLAAIGDVTGATGSTGFTNGNYPLNFGPQFIFTAGTLRNPRSIGLSRGLTQSGGTFEPISDSTHKLGSTLPTYIYGYYSIDSPDATVKIDLFPLDPTNNLLAIDSIRVTRHAHLQGNLDIDFSHFQEIPLGHTYEIIAAQSISGHFKQTRLRDFAVIYDHSDPKEHSVKLVATLPGDANADGVVGPADLTILKTNWQRPNTVWQQGNFNDADGITGPDDLNVLKFHWNRSTDNPFINISTVALRPGTGGIPEPASLALLALTLPLLARRRRR